MYRRGLRTGVGNEFIRGGSIRHNRCRESMLNNEHSLGAGIIRMRLFLTVCPESRHGKVKDIVIAYNFN